MLKSRPDLKLVLPPVTVVVGHCLLSRSVLLYLCGNNITAIRLTTVDVMSRQTDRYDGMRDMWYIFILCVHGRVKILERHVAPGQPCQCLSWSESMWDLVLLKTTPGLSRSRLAGSPFKRLIQAVSFHSKPWAVKHNIFCILRHAAIHYRLPRETR